MLKKLEISGFKSFNQKSALNFDSSVCAVVGPNGSGKSNVIEAIRFALGEQSMKTLRSKKGEDLIFNGSLNTSRSNIARVKVVFDNSNGKMNVDFDEVVVERVVYRDGVNQYLINKSPARLKDISEILAGANIGSSSYHIISQGEADRFLKASTEERRNMIEEALGLTSYRFKKKESERKLNKTCENIKEIEYKKRELSPTLRHLKKELEKAKRAKDIKEKLIELYAEYLKIEREYVDYWNDYSKNRLNKLNQEIENIEKEIQKYKENSELLKESENAKNLKNKLIENKNKIFELSRYKNELSREVGKIEGKLSFLIEEKNKTIEKNTNENFNIPFKNVTEIAEKVFNWANFKEDDSIETLKERLENIKTDINNFLSDFKNNDKGNFKQSNDKKNKKEELENKLENIEKEVKQKEEKENIIIKENEVLKEKINNEEKEKIKEKEKIYKLESDLKDLFYKKERAVEFEDKIEKEREEFKEDLKIATFVLGRRVLSYELREIFDENGNKMDKEKVANEPRQNQKNRKSEIERNRFRLDEAGLGLSIEKTEKEYQETKKQDEFLSKELFDLQSSSKKLGELIVDLENKITLNFKSGVENINKRFQNFFSILFGGGEAKLEISKKPKKKTEEGLLNGTTLSEGKIVEKEGLEISVSMPRKKIKGLEMLSGGERTLTSAALIFAVSQVNPPPFLILDEVDAALDEINSRKFGDMLEELSKRSQLIMVSHNRETMGRAGVLYGVTMSGDGVSKLLSVKFDEAVEMVGE